MASGTSPNFFYETVKGVDSIIQDKYNLIVRDFDNNKDYSKVSKKSFDGIILTSQSDEDDAFIYNVLDKGIPLVVLNREVTGAKVINILSDIYSGAYKIVSYLIDCGHKDIAIIEGKEGFKSTENRREAFIKASIR